MAITTNTANTTVTDRTASGNQPDNTPATGTTTGGSGGSGVSSVSSGSSNVTVTSSGGGGTGAVTISVSGGSGTGNVTGSGTTTVGHVAVFNNTSATGIQDGGPASLTIAGNSVSLGGSVSQDSITGLAATTAGIVKHTATANTLGIAVAADFPTLNQNTTGNAATVTGLSVASGKTLTANNTLTLSGTDGSTLAIGGGGTLGSAAYTASTAYVAASSGTATNLTLAGTLKDSNSSSAGSSGQVLSSLGTGTKWITPSSGGNVTGTSPTVSGNVAVFNNITGTGIQDGGTLGTAAFTASTAYVSATTTQTAHKFLAGPTTGTAAPTFRVIDPTDVPTLNQSTTGNAATATTATTATTAGNVTGIVAVANGGTGTSGPSLINGTGISVTGSWPNQTITNTTSGLPSGAAQGQVLLEGASTAGWYNQSYNVTAFASLSAAITAAGSTGVLYFPTAYTIPSGITISLPIIVEGLLTCSGTATFNGTIQAPLRQIFSGGTVSIGPNTPYIYPEWFGAAKTGSSDDQPAISAALSAVTLASGSSAPNQFVVLTSTYYLGSVLTLTNSQMFKVVGGASFYPYSTYTGDCIVYQYNSNNTLTDIPTIVGFTTGAGLTLLGCKVLKATGFMIKSCKYGIKIKAGASGQEVLDNYVNVHFIPDCQYGVFFTDDGSSATIQGNEIYSNFYTNDNIHTNPWVTDTISKTVDNAVIGLWSVITNLGTTSQTNWNILAHTTGITYSVGSSFLAAVAVSTSGSTGTVTQYYATNIAACYWDNLNVYNWNGNTVQIKAIDINGATNSYGFYNASNFSTYGGYSFLNGWQLGCPLWFGGINSHNLSSAYYMAGYFLDSEFRYAIQTPSSNAPYNLINIQGSSNRFIFARGGGNWNYNTTNGLPQTYYQAQDTANSRSSFATASVAYCAPFTNRIYCTYTISSTIAPSAELTLYVYTPITDAYIQSSIFGASNNFTVQPLANNGLLPEVVYDNSLTNANEVVVKFRNVSGANISSGTFNFMVTVGL